MSVPIRWTLSRIGKSLFLEFHEVMAAQRFNMIREISNRKVDGMHIHFVGFF